MQWMRSNTAKQHVGSESNPGFCHAVFHRMSWKQENPNEITPGTKKTLWYKPTFWSWPKQTPLENEIMVEFCFSVAENSVLLVYDNALWVIASWNFKAIQRPHLHWQRCPRTLHGPLPKMTVLTISKPSSVNEININDASLSDPFFVLKNNDRTEEFRISQTNKLCSVTSLRYEHIPVPD